MRFAVSLFVIAVGALLAFGVTDSPDGVRIHVIGLILILAGLAGLAIGRWLYVTRRRTDIVYGPDQATVLQPNAPPRGELWGAVGRRVPTPPEQNPPTLPLRIPGPPEVRAPRRGLIPAARIVRDPETDRVERVHGVMDVEPGSEEFWRLARLYD